MINPIFASLGRLPGLEAPLYEWRIVVGPKGLRVIEPFLRATNRAATEVHCPLGCGCAHEVISDSLGQSPDQFQAVCVCEDSGGCPDILMEDGDLQVLSLNIAGLGREIARGLNCRCAFTPLSPQGCWQVGAWSSGSVPVLLTLQATRTDMEAALSKIFARMRDPVILLAGNPDLVDARSRELLTATRSGLFGLDEVLRFAAPGILRPIRPPEDLFAAFTADLPELDETGTRKALVLIEKLEAESPCKPPGLVTVFKLYCMDGLSSVEVARKCDCAKTTVIDRLARIRRVTGAEPAALRGLSNQFERTSGELHDPRAERINRIDAMS